MSPLLLRGLVPLLVLPSCYWIPAPGDDTGSLNDSDAPEPLLWYADGDGDGFGRDEERARAASQPEGYVAIGGDCDDADPQIRPDATEICDGRDNNCDAQIDDADPDIEGAVPWYLDGDGDGHGDANVAPILACEAPEGRVADALDCDDKRDDISPSAAELGCDLVDHDCDGQDWPRSVAPADSEWSATFTDLAEALTDETGGALICLAPGLYQAVDLDLGAQELALVGAACNTDSPEEDCASRTVLDAGGAGRVLSIQGGQTERTALFGFTVTGGSAALGGGLYIEGSAPTLERLVLLNNHADTTGGGLYAVTSGDLTLWDVQVRDNTASGQGAGLAVTTAGDAGAPMTATVTLGGCQLEGNLATFDHGGASLATIGGAAGAVWAAGDDTLNIEVQGCDVLNNHVEPTTSGASSGPTGGLWLVGAAVSVTDSAFTGNSSQSGLNGSNASGAGGALFVSASAGATLTRLSFVDNSDLSSGGALVLNAGSGDSTLSDSTFTGNQAGYFGSALVASSSLEITGVTFSANEVVTAGPTEGGAATLKVLSGDSGVVYRLSDVVFDANSSVNYAGALYGYQLEELTVEDSRFTNNTSNKSGGAIFLGGSDATITLTRLVLDGNQSGSSGGAMGTNQGGALRLTESELSNNSAPSSGGGALYLVGLAEVEILGSNFSFNTSRSGGAVLFSGASTTTQTVRLAQSSFVMNDAGAGNGGALALSGSSAAVPVVVTGENVILLGNSAASGGAVSVETYSSLSLTNAAVVANVALGEGGGIWVYSSANGLSLQNTTLVGNTTTNAAGPAVYAYPAVPSVNILYSHIYNNSNGSNSVQLAGRYSDTDFVADGNLYGGDPLFTSTSAADMSAWSLTLQAGSPLIDVGDPTLSDPDGSRADIGAYGGPGGSW